MQHTEQQLQQQREADISEASSFKPSPAEQQSSSSNAAVAAAPAPPLQHEDSEAAEESCTAQLMLPVTWLSYKGQDSNIFLVWVAGRGAGQVSSRAAADVAGQR